MTACCPPQEIPGIESHTLTCVLARPDHLTSVTARAELAAARTRTTDDTDRTEESHE